MRQRWLAAESCCLAAATATSDSRCRAATAATLGCGRWMLDQRSLCLTRRRNVSQRRLVSARDAAVGGLYRDNASGRDRHGQQLPNA